jgi:hypothetical protein
MKFTRRLLLLLLFRQLSYFPVDFYPSSSFSSTYFFCLLLLYCLLSVHVV